MLANHLIEHRSSCFWPIILPHVNKIQKNNVLNLYKPTGAGNVQSNCISSVVWVAQGVVGVPDAIHRF